MQVQQDLFVLVWPQELRASKAERITLRRGVRCSGRRRVRSHYGKPGLRRAFRTHGKGQETHGKAFAVRFSWKRTAKRTRRHFAR
jgi:hypothetical protein